VRALQSNSHYTLNPVKGQLEKMKDIQTRN
jgi:hypothetical protein